MGSGRPPGGSGCTATAPLRPLQRRGGERTSACSCSAGDPLSTLLDTVRPDTLEHIERRTVAAAAVERDDQVMCQALVVRMVDDERLELRAGVLAELQLRLDLQLERREAELFQRLISAWAKSS